MHFERANFFAIVDLNDEIKVRFEKTVENTLVAEASQLILDFKPDIFITHRIGVGALEKNLGWLGLRFYGEYKKAH